MEASWMVLKFMLSLLEAKRSEAIEEYLLGCARHYGERKLSAVQLIYPTTQGVWPWDAKASKWFKSA
jgi:hypothetical protein